MVANLVQIQDKLKDLSDNQLRTAYSQGTVPQFLVMTEMGRRKEMKEEYQKNQAQGSTTVAEDILSPATNMARGLGAMAQPQNRMATQPQNLPVEQSMATMPPSPQPMANKLPVTRMADGGLAKIKARNGMSLAYDPSYVGSLFPGGSFSPEAFRELYLGQVPADQQRQSSVRSGLRAGSDVGAGTFYTPRGAMEAAFPSDMDARTKAIEAVAATYKQPSIFSRIFNRSGDATPEIAGYPTAEAAAAAPASASAPSKLVPGGYEPRRSPFDPIKFDASKLDFNIPAAAPAAPAAPAAAPAAPAAAAAAAAPAAAPAAADTSGLAALSTEIGKVASRTYQADANLIPSSLTAREADVTKFLGAINPSAASAYAGFQTKLKARGEGIEEARDEAQGFALIEAALRIAGSKGATIGEAVSDAAPALASYQKSASSLRKEEALIMGEEMKLAQLQEAEKAGRKAEAASLRKELGEIGANIRSIKVEDRKLFNQSKQADIAVLQARVTVANAKTDAEYKQELVRLKKAEDSRAAISAENIANRANVEIGTLTNQLKTETDPAKRQLIGDQIRNQEQIKQNATATAQAFAKYDPYKKATAESQVRGSIVSMLKQRTSVLDAQRKAQQTALTIQNPEERKEYLKRFDDSLKTIDSQITAANKTLKSIQDGSYTASGGGNRIIIPADQLPTGR